MAIKKIMLSVDEDIVKELDQMARNDDRSRNNYINRIISDYLHSEDKTNELLKKIEELEKDLIEKNLVIKNLPQQIQTPTNNPIIVEEKKSSFSNPMLDEIDF